MQIILVRHGETIANKAQLVLGTSDAPLTEVGRNQAKAAAQKISSMETSPTILFVNGLPLVILEYKDPSNHSVDITHAYNQLGKTMYQRYIPRLFNYISFLIYECGFFKTVSKGLFLENFVCRYISCFGVSKPCKPCTFLKEELLSFPQISKF